MLQLVGFAPFGPSGPFGPPRPDAPDLALIPYYGAAKLRPPFARTGLMQTKRLIGLLLVALVQACATPSSPPSEPATHDVALPAPAAQTPAPAPTPQAPT